MMSSTFKDSFVLQTTPFISIASFYLILIIIVGMSTTNLADNNPHQLVGAQNLSNSQHRQALNYLLFSSSRQHQQQQANDLKLDRLLKDSNHSHVSDAIDLQLANKVWKKMQQNALEFAQQRAEEARPTINMLLEQANISTTCNRAINGAIDRLAKLDQWAMESK